MTERLTVDTLTSEQLDALQDERDRLGYEVQQWKATYGEHALRDTLARLNRAERAVERVEALAYRWENALTPDLRYARSLRAALAGTKVPAAEGGR